MRLRRKKTKLLFKNSLTTPSHTKSLLQTKNTLTHSRANTYAHTLEFNCNNFKLNMNAFVLGFGKTVHNLWVSKEETNLLLSVVCQVCLSVR
eukprot:m.28464 g.28464  ORF g.28464 m.28464 type:complete len:92 (+) comp9475_c0_seq2:2279-2554(+)